MTQLQSKLILGFSQISYGAIIEYDSDLKKILELSECAGIGAIVDSDSIIDNIVTRVISYLRTYFEYMQATLDSNNFYDK